MAQLDQEAYLKGQHSSITPSSHAATDYNGLHVSCPPHTTERALVTRIDLRVVPFLCVLFLLGFLDRVNIANAKSFKLIDDLHLDLKLQYNTALTIFFIPFVLFEIPANAFLKRMRPRVWLSGCMFCFGLVTISQGLVRNYGGLLVTRFFLGFFEAGLFPGCFYLIGMWYKRSEAQRRYSFFFGSTSLAGAFGGLLASAIGNMQGLRGYNGWRWIFILEGILTCTVAAVFLFFIPSFPEDAEWLTGQERSYVIARLQVDQGRSAAERNISARDVLKFFKDYKVFLAGLMYQGVIVSAYGYAFFAPSIITTYGYSPIKTQLYSVPPWTCALAFSLTNAWFSDKLQHRLSFALIPISISMTGFSILIAVHNNLMLQYAALFLVAMGTFSTLPVLVCWFSMNLGGHHRRAVGVAWQIGFGNIGGIIATYAFTQDDSVNFYRKGHSICLGFLCLSAVSCCAYAWAITSQNQKRNNMPITGLTNYEKRELGDLSPDYRYML